MLARQADGVHFSRAGAVVPARLILRAMAKDYRVLRGKRMRRAASALALIGLLAAPAGAHALKPPPARERRLAGGRHEALLPKELRGWKVTQSAEVSRHATRART